MVIGEVSTMKDVMVCTVHLIKARRLRWAGRMRWAGHIARREKYRSVFKMLLSISEETIMEASA